MFRKFRIIIATLCFVLLTLLFCDFTGLGVYCAFLAKLQFIPAILAKSFFVVTGILVATLLFGRFYCSSLCPLGVLQDIVSHLASRRKKNRFGWQPNKFFWRLGFLILFLVLSLVGAGSLAALLDPYGAFGRIASNLITPVYRYGNNLLAGFAEQTGSYAFYSVDIWMKGTTTFLIAVVMLALVSFFAFRWGRLYCNTFCPVGAILGFVAKFTIFKPVIDTTKCNGCGLCAKNCKSSCINPQVHSIDTSRCVVCFDCLEKCPQKALSYGIKNKIKSDTFTMDNIVATKHKSNETPHNITASVDNPVEESTEETGVFRGHTVRRGFLSLLLLSLVSNSGSAQEPSKRKKKEFDGGLAPLLPRVSPTRTVAPLPPGSLSVRNFARRCVGCQLCVSACPNQVLRPSAEFKSMMQPVMSFERGYCRPECVRCSEVCPTGAITTMNTADKSATQIGYAVWVRDACVVITDELECGNCERHCPTQAIEMVPMDPNDPHSRKIPTVNVERCIGCGACENLCPARPTSAMYVEGVDRQRII